MRNLERPAGEPPDEPQKPCGNDLDYITVSFRPPPYGEQLTLKILIAEKLGNDREVDRLLHRKAAWISINRKMKAKVSEAGPDFYHIGKG